MKTHDVGQKPIRGQARDLGVRLADYRLSRNLRQSDLAERSGISRGVIARIESGQGGTIDSLLRIMQALGFEDRAEILFPDARLSPLDPRSKIGSRQRASSQRADEPVHKAWSWAD